MNTLPETIAPVYKTKNPNDSIILFEGSFELKYLNCVKDKDELEEENKDQLEIVKGSRGILEYTWIPSPKFQLKLFYKKSNSRDFWDISYSSLAEEGYISSLTLSNNTNSINIPISDVIFSFFDYERYILGTIQETIKKSNCPNLKYLTFHVANFCEDSGSEETELLENKRTRKNKNRVTLIFKEKFKEWKITLDRLFNAPQDISLFRKLNSEGGYAITHVGKIEKLDQTSFSDKEVTNIIEILKDFLSFVRGWRVCPIFFIGYDANNNQVWEDWPSLKEQLDPWNPELKSWFSDRKHRLPKKNY